MKREGGVPEEDDELLLDRSDGQRIGGLGIIEERYWVESGAQHVTPE